MLRHLLLGELVGRRLIREDGKETSFVSEDVDFISLY
jgi:hypothetical protein